MSSPTATAQLYHLLSRNKCVSRCASKPRSTPDKKPACWKSQNDASSRADIERE